MYYSLHDKMVLFDRGVHSIGLLKNNGFKQVQVKIDKSKKHNVDNFCLEYLEKTLVKKIGEVNRNKIASEENNEMKPKF